MFWVTTITALIVGVIAAANLLLERKPNAKVNHGVIGLIGFVIGLVSQVKIALSHMDLIPLIQANLLTVLSLLLAADLIKYLVRTEQLDQLVAKLKPVKGILGLVLIALSLYALLPYVTTA